VEVTAHDGTDDEPRRTVQQRGEKGLERAPSMLYVLTVETMAAWFYLAASGARHLISWETVK